MNNKIILSLLCFVSACFGVCEIECIRPSGLSEKYELPDDNTPAHLFKALGLGKPDCIETNMQLCIGTDLLTPEHFPLKHGSTITMILDSRYPHSLHIWDRTNNIKVILLGDFTELNLPKEELMPMLCPMLFQNTPEIQQLIELTKAVNLKMPNGEKCKISQETTFTHEDFQKILMAPKFQGAGDMVKDTYTVEIVKKCIAGLE